MPALGGEGRDAASHLRWVAEDTKSEAAAFELHLQGGTPGHCDPAPMVSREHAGSPLLRALPALRGSVSLVLGLRSLDGCPLTSAAGNLPSLPGSQTPPPETTPGLGRARHPPLPPPLKAWPLLGAKPIWVNSFRARGTLNHSSTARELLPFWLDQFTCIWSGSSNPLPCSSSHLSNWSPGARKTC